MSFSRPFYAVCVRVYIIYLLVGDGVSTVRFDLIELDTADSHPATFGSTISVDFIWLLHCLKFVCKRGGRGLKKSFLKKK